MACIGILTTLIFIKFVMRCRLCGSVFLILIFSDDVKGMQNRHPHVYDSHAAKKVNAKVQERKYKDAIELSLAIATEMKAESNVEGYIYFMLRAAEVETFEVWKAKGFHSDYYPDYRRPLRYLRELQKEAGRLLPAYPVLNAKALFTSAVVYYWLDMPDTSLVLHHQAMHLNKKLFGDSSREVADSYLWRAVTYKRGLHRKDLAERDYNNALILQQKYMPASRYALGSVYYGLAHIAMENYQFDEAMAFANQYLLLYHDLPYEQAFGLQLIANVYWNQENFESSLFYRQQAIELYERSGFTEDLILEYSNLANDLLNLKRYNEAENIVKKGVEILSRGKIPDPYYASMLFSTFGKVYSSVGKYEAAAVYFQQSLDIATQQYGDRNDAVANIYALRGDMLKLQKLFQQALMDYQKMLVAVVPGFDAADYRAIPPVQQDNPYFRNIITASFKKGDGFLQWYRASRDTSRLRLALRNYKHARHQVLIARQTIGDEMSKPFLVSNFQTSIENSIASAFAMYQITHDNLYIQEVFEIMEFTKYLNVLDALQRSERASNSNIPVELMFELGSVRSELNRLQTIELDAKHLALSDDSVRTLQQHIVDLLQRRKNLLKVIQREDNGNPARSSSYPLGNIQEQMADDEQILEFFWGNDSIYVLSLTKHKASVAAVSHEGRIDSMLFSVQNMLQSQHSYYPRDVEKYSRSASYIYARLFAPVIIKRKVLVIPDGPLSLIPIEALVVRHEQKHSYRDLAYVVKERQIWYAYSAGIVFHKQRKTEGSIEKVLAFSYNANRPEAAAQSQELASLAGAAMEMQALAEIFKNLSAFTGQEAVKANFFKQVASCDLIHLGLHGIGNSERADHSRLIFRSDSLLTEDLYAYEVYNLKLQASLAVLSACETASGKHQQGEGIFSIGRAFTYAGCPSVVMSLWRAHDLHTAAIMKDFYLNLRDGNSISASLQLAKRNFIEEADDFSSHPANWAAFIHNGEDQSFQKEHSTFTAWLLAIVILPLSYFLVIMRRKLRIKR